VNPRLRCLLALAFPLAGCGISANKGDSGAAQGPVDPCGQAAELHRPPTDELELSYVIDDVQRIVFGAELRDVEVGLAPLPSETDFFNAGVDLTTADLPGLERRYIIRANSAIFSGDEPPIGATTAIVAHELEHVLDYTAMSGDELVDFALEYSEGDISQYERQTDEAVMVRGCATGLKAYREWLYEQLDAEAEAAKRRDYYTPDEIDAWVADHGG
jgi:hypothetical protein